MFVGSMRQAPTRSESCTAIAAPCSGLKQHQHAGSKAQTAIDIWQQPAAAPCISTSTQHTAKQHPAATPTAAPCNGTLQWHQHPSSKARTAERFWPACTREVDHACACHLLAEFDVEAMSGHTLRRSEVKRWVKCGVPTELIMYLLFSHSGLHGRCWGTLTSIPPLAHHFR